MQTIKRCKWISNVVDVQYLKYHDTEWGQPMHDDVKLFESICLEGQSCGLSWLTILKKREDYRKAFHNFDPEKISKMTEKDIDILMKHPALIKNRPKLNSVVDNSKVFQKMKESNESFSKYLWSFVNHKTIHNNDSNRITTSPQSDAMAASLKKKGFKFIGTTTCYAFMQHAGMCNDHCSDCHYNPLKSSSTTSNVTTTKSLDISITNVEVKMIDEAQENLENDIDEDVSSSPTIVVKKAPKIKKTKDTPVPKKPVNRKKKATVSKKAK
ncbi:DNA-3-methyladenine glycosylase I [Tieghemostelium lacteum]|uniref:DNA-3-methyladenine glycosylase I n=1 Tax=Tieghemostelium lacteum TaxID=361077 RepID=A0A151Z3N7_TIELA|nr:DNA-3-methyladenine glycosylase I [Tieghemostelium lacteum]|eukprot:KYQ88558.1 DNA-3-methyladenine glycosylase I [Tieghemostelium lacteum]